MTDITTETTQQAPAQEQTPTPPVVTEGTITPPAPELPTLQSEQEDGETTFEYSPTGNAGLDVALAFVGSLGFGGETPAMQAAATGDFSILEAQLAALGDKAKGWERMVTLAKDAFEQSKSAAAAKASASEQAILSVVGGTEEWDAIKQWAAKNATPEEKAEINRLVDGGPVSARAAATLLRDTYRKATGTVVLPKNAAPNAGNTPAAADNSRLSRAEYGKEVRALYAKLGSRMEGSQEYAALQKRLAR